MKKDVMEKWVAALRSGKYKQGFGVLERMGRFCCLGVLTHILEQPTKEGTLTKNILSKETRELSGVKYSLGEFTDNNGETHKLSHLNDVRQMPFSLLADIIETHYTRL